jgi:ubiquinone/menaquinone biosynthesis C-methylase UbiE
MTWVAKTRWYGRMTQNRSRRIAAAVASFVPDQAEILDFGCGNGFTALSLMSMRPCRITGLDVIHDVNLTEDTARRIAFTLFDGGAIPFKDNFFDGVLASAVMHHTPDPVFYLDEFIRVIRPGGRIFLVEEMYRSVPGKWLLQGHDYLLNKLKEEVPLPLNFFSLRKYKKLFEERGLDILHHGCVRPIFPYVRHEVFVLQVP